MKSRVLVIALLGLGHGLNDFIAGYFLGGIVHLKIETLQIATYLFLYNLLAFGGQYPFAVLLERYNYPKKFVTASYVVNLVAIISFSILPGLSIFLAGIASAVYHVAGGTECAQKNKAVNIGLFAAPGVAGLIAGGYLAWLQINLVPVMAMAAIIFLAAVLRIPFLSRSGKSTESEKHRLSVVDGHDMVMMLLLTFISLRSAIWNVFQLIHENEFDWLIAIACSAFAGKIIGGWVADRIGWRLYSLISLVLAMPLLTFFKKELLLFTIGIGLLQSSIPATTSLLIRFTGEKTERAIGLSFGTTIMAGALLFYTPLRVFFLSNTVLWMAGAGMIMILVLIAKKMNIASLKINAK